MYMTDILVAIVSITNLAVAILLVILIRSITRTAHITADEHIDEVFDARDDGVSIQEHILIREEQFNERIKRMKEDLDQPSSAEELHPDVHNLPHNIIHGGTQIVETSE